MDLVPYSNFEDEDAIPNIQSYQIEENLDDFFIQAYYKGTLLSDTNT